ncbi:DUF7827 domain-containing protein [Natronobiforma cellulositropha]|uniref:DUF7827 domain-containing protein n=1 Tax=Natronobiforma cellulositropha TaxID=1679076 RepID=UPI0021D5E5A2|nr:BGTF surface domain-containing protein [Natronobiforma cellulositropha]
MTGKYTKKTRAVFLAALMVLSVVAMSATLPGAVVADDHDVEDFSDGERYWQGQTIVVEPADVDNDNGGVFAADATYEIISNDTQGLERQISVSSGEENFTIDTTRFDTGLYDIEESDGTHHGEFRIDEQRLDVDIESDLPVQYEGTAEVEVDSQRSGYTLTVHSDDLDVDEITAAFSDYAGTVDNDSEWLDDDQIALEGVSSIQSLDIDFDGLDAGNYTFEFGAADTTASDEVTIEVAEEGEIDAAFTDRIVSVPQGDVAEIGVDIDGDRDVRIQIGSSDVNYIANATITDTEDGHAIVEFDTFGAGNSTINPAPIAAGEDTDLTFDDQTQNALSSPLVAGNYDMRLFIDGDRVDIGTLRLGDRSTDDVTIHTAPEDVNAGDDLEDILEAASVDNEIAYEDLVIVQVEASGLQGLWESGLNLEAYGVEWEFEHLNPAPNTEGNDIDSAIAEHQDFENNSIYFAFDSDSNGIEEDDQYEFTFTVGEDNPYISSDDDEESVSATFTVAERSIEFSQEEFSVAASDGQVIDGTSNAAAGTEIEVIVEGTGDNPFFMTQDTEVEDGEWAVEFDFSDEAEGAEFDLEVSDVSGAEDEATGVISSAPDDEPEELSLSVGDVTVEEGEDATISGTVTAGDEDVSGEAVLLLNGDEVASEDLELEAGEDATLEATISADDLSVGTHDIELTFDGESATGTLTVEEEAAPPEEEDDTGADDEGADDDDGADDVETPGTDDDDPADDDGQPGFGIAVAIVALLGAAMLALRRQD